MTPRKSKRDKTRRQGPQSSLHLGLDSFLNSQSGKGESLFGAPTFLEPGSRSAGVPLLEPLPAGTMFSKRYRVLRCLGRGGFSDVYLAVDLELDRRVAVKRSLNLEVNIDSALNEAKLVASLDHPSIVRVFDVVHDPHFGVLIVMQYVTGPTLRLAMNRERLSVRRSVEIAKRLAMAADHAHSKRIVHRDIKPANVLFDNYDNPLLSDFGLAWKPTWEKLASTVSGTLRYMSPEQMRGEIHRIDARSDVFSLGILLYEMLTDRLPFDGNSRSEVAKATISEEPVALRSLNPDVSIELDRICRRAMRKSVKDRYASMQEFADALQGVLDGGDLATDATAKPPPRVHASLGSRIVDTTSYVRDLLAPRGIEPFGRADAEGYLELAPGPRHPSGLPEAILHWKDWIESKDPTEHFRLAVLYGPPGSGKTSFMQAGVLPNLSPEIGVVTVDCRSGNLAKRIVQAVVEHFQLPSSDESLTELLMRLRVQIESESSPLKIVIVLDHFEIWAQRASASQYQLVAAAFRQCDGTRLKIILVASDEHWRTVTKLTELVEVTLLEGKNSFAMELLGPSQAKKILESMGRFYGTLPSDAESYESKDSFSYFDDELDRIVAVLGRGRGAQILPTQLTMFAQMASIHQWNPSILEQAGGLTGLYVAHFEDFFESNTAPPRRAHAMPAAIDILTQLLPSEEQSVRDIQLSASEIQQHMGRQCSVAEIEVVCSLLVDELKVVVELETSDAFPEGLAFDSLARVDTRKYRIGHDLQVPPIRMWTEQATQITATGRSVARFRELARMWERRPDERFLPSLGEYLAIRRGAKVLNLTEPQARYLAATNAYFLRRGILASGLLCVLGLIFGLAWFQHRVAVETKLLMINSKLDGLISSDVGEVPRLLDELETLPDRRRVLEIANRWMQVDGKRTKTRCTLLVSRLDPKQLNSLYAKIADIEPALGAEVVELAERHPESKQYLLQRISQQSDPVALARAAITLGATGDQQALTSLLAADKGLGLVNLLLDEATRWRAPPSMWLELVANSTGLMRYHALVALGSYPDAVLAQLPGIESFLLGELGSQNSSLHSISRWLCERLGIDTGAVTAPPLAQWEITPSGMELIRIPLHELEPRRSGVVIRGRAAGDASQVAQRHVWITSKAISSELMDRFYRQSLGEPALDVSGHLGGLTRGFPAVAVENDDIAGLCNWLSELDGLEPVYTFADSVTTDSKNVGEQKPARTFTAEASRTGYRLATVEELANAHLITSPAAYGTEFVANMFRAVQGSGREQFPNVSWQVQSNLPNRLGVFCNDNSGWILAGNDHFSQVFGFGTEGNFVEIDVGKLDSVFVQHRIFLSRPE